MLSPTTNHSQIESLLKRDTDEYVQQFDFNTPLSKRLNGYKIFKVTHESMVEKWNINTDYALGIIKEGICKGCCDYLFAIHKPKEVVTQVGAAKFGLQVGFCFICINHLLTEQQSDSLKMKIPFQDSKDVHMVSLDLHLLKELSERVSPIGESEAEQIPSEINQMLLKKIVADNKGMLEKCEQEQAKKIQCKTCKKLSTDSTTLLETMNTLRLTRVAGCCLGCAALLNIKSGCSIAPCSSCVSNTKTCLVCVEGATGLPHNLVDCSAKMQKFIENPETHPLPPVEKCQCSD